MTTSVDVIVLGGGAVGLCVAEALHRRGARVQVLERGRCGGAASAGNAGWITPGISNPLPAPGTVAQALRWMVNPGSPLLVHPRLDPRFLRWAYDFWRSTTPARYSAGMVSLVALGRRAIPAYDALRAAGVEFEMHADGLLFVARDAELLEDERRALVDQRAFGYAGALHALDAAEVRAFEPALADGVAGGIWAVDERHVRPETLTRGLTEHLRAHGVNVREHAPARALAGGAKGWTVRLADGAAVTAGQVVVALGADTSALLHPLGVRLPLQGAKGYSVTESGRTPRPRRPLYLLDAKVGVSPFAGAVRLAGTLELGSRAGAVAPRRLRALDDAGARYLTGWAASSTRAGWAGLRPLLPDGLPAIGPVPGHEGLHVATGHAMLGITLAPATAEVLTPAVLDGQTRLELAPFSVARFDNRAAADGAALQPMTTSALTSAGAPREAQ